MIETASKHIQHPPFSAIFATERTGRLLAPVEANLKKLVNETWPYQSSLTQVQTGPFTS